MSLRGVLSVFLFELRRLMTFPRLLWWAGLAAFPVVIIAVSRVDWTLERAAPVIFMLAGGVVCLLGLLLTATSTVHSEIEGRTWTYLAVRPHGKTSLVVGKYLAAVAWSATAGWIGLSGAFFVSGVDGFAAVWWRLAGLVLLSSLAYGGLFTLIGVLFFKRAMAIAFAYVMLVEVMVSMVRAVVNQVTVHFHLRTLMLRALPGDFQPRGAEALFGESPAWQHAAILCLYAGVSLLVAILALRQRELATQEE